MNSMVFRNISYGVYIVTTMDGDRPTGCTANSVMQITSTPATIAVSMNHNNFTNECISKTKKFAISILTESSEPSIIGTFGFQSGRDVDKLKNIEYEIKGNLPVIKDSSGYIICDVIDKMETETHTVFLGKVIDGDVISDEKVMTYEYYHKVIKGKSPKNAPTYIPDEDRSQNTEKPEYVCQVCGFVYKGEQLPEDYVCPVCGQGAEYFKKKQ